ncbi:MAG: hypothetical protein EPO67_08515, partial [Reyranella sp.]
MYWKARGSAQSSCCAACSDIRIPSCAVRRVTSPMAPTGICGGPSSTAWRPPMRCAMRPIRPSPARGRPSSPSARKRHMPEPDRPAVDLTNCDREPIHLLGAVQPFGFLVAADSASASWPVTRASANVEQWLGKPVDQVIGQPLDQVFTAEAVHAIRGHLQTAVFTNTVARAFAVPMLGGGTRFDIAVHVVENSVIVECEPCVHEQGVNSGALVRAMVARLQQTPDLRAFYRVAAREMRGLTGFDRVMVYRFDQDGSGEVIAESARSGL